MPISKTVIKLFGAYILCVAMLVVSFVVLARHYYPKVKEEVHCLMAKPQDCDHVKETCNRKKGCKCQLRCDPEGRRLPPAGGVTECPSYCCEEKCECHAMGCP
jgi:hypothetical protein